jgi:hypothetical protein
MMEADLSRDMGIEFSDLIQRICSCQKLDSAGFHRFSGNLAYFIPLNTLLAGVFIAECATLFIAILRQYFTMRHAG